MTKEPTIVVSLGETAKVFNGLTRSAIAVLIDLNSGPRAYITSSDKRYYSKRELFKWLEELGFKTDEIY